MGHAFCLIRLVMGFFFSLSSLRPDIRSKAHASLLCLLAVISLRITWVGRLITGLIAVFCVCGSIWIIALAYHQIAMMGIRRQREYYSRRYIVAGNLVAYHQEDSDPRNLSAEHEAAKLLPAPVIVTEEKRDDEDVKRSKILNLRAKGRSLHEIVSELNIPYNQVQKICAAATNLVIEK